MRTWTFLLLGVGTGVLLFSSAFFDLPLPLKTIIFRTISPSAGPTPSTNPPAERHENDNAAKATTPTLPLVSTQFTNLISRGSDIKEVKAFVNQNKAILNGVSQYGAYGLLLEDISEFPINDTLKPDFTRFIFRPHFAQVANYIIFIDFMSPQASIFEIGSKLSEVANSAKARMEQYISTTRANYKDYTIRVVQLQNFNIPLARLQGYDISISGDNDLKGDFPTMIKGAIVIGRRRLLSGGQLKYLSNNNETSRIRIITYDYIVDFLKEEEGKTKVDDK